MERIPCARKECPNRAAWRPMLIIWPIGRFREGDPARALCDLKLCTEHMQTLRREDLMDADGWASLRAVFAQQGKLPPDLERAEVRRIAIQDPANN